MSYISTCSYFLPLIRKIMHLKERNWKSKLGSKRTSNWAQIGLKIGLKCKKWTLKNGENPVISMVRLAGIEPAHPVPETGALSPEL